MLSPAIPKMEVPLHRRGAALVFNRVDADSSDSAGSAGARREDVEDGEIGAASAHAPLRPPDASEVPGLGYAASAASEKKYLCKYFLKSACIRGTNCTFSHDLSKFPCKLFHIKNNCKRRNCQFSHAPITPEELEALKAGDGGGWAASGESGGDGIDSFQSPFLVNKPK